MREYDLKKALSTGSYTRNSIKPQLLVAEDGEYRQGDILDANATMEVVNSTASDIDDKINDILGVDNGAVQELVGILSDSDTTTGILNELAKKANISDLETVAGDIPQVPTNVSAFTNDAGYLTQHQDISGKANSSDLSTVATSGSYNDLSNKPNLANVATSGSYEDLSNKPHIPEDPVQSDWTEDDTTDQAYIKNKPNLATVATTGDYTDLSNKPTIPTKLSDLQNDVHFTSEGANGHDYVEIGGVKWATMNIGASSITGEGLYFQWGDIQGYSSDSIGTEEGKKHFSLSDYKYYQEGYIDVVKEQYPGVDTINPGNDEANRQYNTTKYNILDRKTRLDINDDAANAQWGGCWRMPTEEEFRLLREATNVEITSLQVGNSLVTGLLFTDKLDNSKTLFFPTINRYQDGEKSSSHEGRYWTSILSEFTFISGKSLVFTDTPSQGLDPISWPFGEENDVFNESGITPRYCGMLVRAVLDSTIQIQPDWAENDNTKAEYIKNKPTIPTSKVAVTGDYNDLVNKPIIRSESLTLNLSDQTSTITGANNSGRVEIVIYDNTSHNDYTVSISTSYKTVDGNQIVLSVPAGCYGEVCYTNIGGTIFAKGIKQLANS